MPQEGPKTLKNDVPEGLEIQLACKGSPRWLRWPPRAPFLRPYSIDFWLIPTSIFKVAYYFPARVFVDFSYQFGPNMPDTLDRLDRAAKQTDHTDKTDRP